MKRNWLVAVLISCLVVFSIVACGSSSGSSKEEGLQTKIKNHIDVDEIELVSMDEIGITLSFTQKHMNIMILPKSFEIAGERYDPFGPDEELNPQVHFRVDGGDTDSFSLDIKEGETHTANISVDGVTDYTHFKATVDNTLYQDSGKSFPVRDVSFEVITD